MKEIWKPILYGYYEVSSLGKVRRVRPSKYGGAVVGRILKPQVIGAGYLAVSLCVDGFVTQCRLHRLVARAFLGPCPSGKEVNHKDGVKRNCRVSNLEYATKSENQRHALKLGLRNFDGIWGRGKEG